MWKIVCIQYNAILDLSVWLRAGSIPEDINRFLSHTGNHVLVLVLNLPLNLYNDLYSRLQDLAGHDIYGGLKIV